MEVLAVAALIVAACIGLSFAIHVIILAPLRQLRAYDDMARVLKRQRDEARRDGTEFIAPRVMGDMFKDR